MGIRKLLCTGELHEGLLRLESPVDEEIQSQKAYTIRVRTAVAYRLGWEAMVLRPSRTTKERTNNPAGGAVLPATTRASAPRTRSLAGCNMSIPQTVFLTPSQTSSCLPSSLPPVCSDEAYSELFVTELQEDKLRDSKPFVTADLSRPSRRPLPLLRPLLGLRSRSSA